MPSGFKESPKINAATHRVPEFPIPISRQSGSILPLRVYRATSWVSLVFMGPLLLIRLGMFHMLVPHVRVPSSQPMQLNLTVVLAFNLCFIMHFHCGIFLMEISTII